MPAIETPLVLNVQRCTVGFVPNASRYDLMAA